MWFELPVMAEVVGRTRALYYPNDDKVKHGTVKTLVCFDRGEGKEMEPIRYKFKYYDADAIIHKWNKNGHTPSPDHVSQHNR